MSSRIPTPGDDDDTQCVESRIRDALAGRCVRDVAVNPQEQIATVLFDGQYNQETAKEIVREEVEPILDEWYVDGIPAPRAHVDVAEPTQACGLRVISLDNQSIDGHDIYRDTHGVVTGGLGAYLNDFLIDSHDIPSTYSQWDDEFDTATTGRNEDVVFEGPVGEAVDTDEARQFCFKSEYVRTGVRILTGGGRFDADEFTFHEAVPFAVLEHPIASLAIAPVERKLCLNSVDHPDFIYSAAGNDDFRVLE